MRGDILVYIAGPVTPAEGQTEEEHTAAAVKVYATFIMSGIPAFCPHLQSAYPTLRHVAYETWMDYTFAIISRCTHIYFLPGWYYSKGTLREKEYAASLGLQVVTDIRELINGVAT